MVAKYIKKVKYVDIEAIDKWIQIHNTFCPCLSEINRTSYELAQVINEEQIHLLMGLFVTKDVNCSRTTIINQSYKKVKL